jgi:hypothetical protein
MTVCGPGGRTDFVEIPPESVLTCREREVPLGGTSAQRAETDEARGIQSDAKTRDVADRHRTLDNHDDLAPMRSHQMAERSQTLRRDSDNIVDDDHRGCAIYWSIASGSYRAHPLDIDPKCALSIAAVPEHELPTGLIAGQPTHQRRSSGSEDACEHDVPAFIE